MDYRFFVVHSKPRLVLREIVEKSVPVPLLVQLLMFQSCGLIGINCIEKNGTAAQELNAIANGLK